MEPGSSLVDLYTACPECDRQLEVNKKCNMELAKARLSALGSKTHLCLEDCRGVEVTCSVMFLQAQRDFAELHKSSNGPSSEKDALTEQLNALKAKIRWATII